MLSPELCIRVATELNLNVRSVAATLALFEEGNTLPFIARYRKEATGGLDEIQLRDVRDRADFLREMEARRAAILQSIQEQGKLDAELEARIRGADTKQALEDLYLPFKPKRRTRATIAKERGLEPLADLLWEGALDDTGIAAAAAGFVDAAKEVETTDAALAGARDILAERIAEDADVRAWIRDRTRAAGVVKSRVVTGKEHEISKFQDYYDFGEKLTTIPSHRVLAIRRGEEEGFLTWSVEAPVDELTTWLEARVQQGRRAKEQLRLVAADAYKRLIALSIQVELRIELKNRADEEAIRIFGMNLEQLLMASPAGERVVIGLDPGFRTGVKVAAVSRTGAVVATDAWYLHQPDRFAASLLVLLARTKAELIAIGNGTASRETETLTRQVLAEAKQLAPKPMVVVVNEAGASVYSASELARDELPDLDVSLRGAVSIARRLQDPLAELVKIDPKSIGVGQYQHDVNQPSLKKRLEETVVSCVNRVGVEVNTASVALLSYVAGVGPTLAQNIVQWRDAKGRVSSRKDLLEVPRLGAKAFEQAAGFLRVRGGAHPLDATAVHPERYPLVEKIAADLGTPLPELLADEQRLNKLDLTRYVSAEVGLPTLQDIVTELRKPGRDPRQAFEPPAFREDIKEPKDLHPGMVLEGVVTNLVAFGAFVDIGVHQDGLVHVSQVADRYVADASEVLTVGQKVKVTVMNVDLERNRIALSMKSNPGAGGGAPGARGGRDAARDGSRDGARNGARDGGRAGRGGSPVKAPAQPVVPRSGTVAPNGMRFK
ncbi:MAG: Tex family protein [Gemmatimonadaceae bacterium]